VSGDLQTSGPGIGNNGDYNGNDDTILTLGPVTPDAFGQRFVDVEKIADAFAYVGIFELVVR